NIEDVSCTFDAFYYPLDKQECELVFSLESNLMQHIQPGMIETHAHYLGEKLISSFYVNEISSTAYNISEDNFKINLIFVRQPVLIMLSTIIPTIMLTSIGYGTLYVKTSLVQVRLIVSLTTLLVMYTLFSNTIQILPKTSYVKMVDVWFLFCISILFFIIIFHYTTSYIFDERDKVKLFHSYTINLDYVIKSVRYLV
ncbi:unnamed protein product, partial [Meganyctiphanes norvegica]